MYSQMISVLDQIRTTNLLLQELSDICVDTIEDFKLKVNDNHIMLSTGTTYKSLRVVMPLFSIILYFTNPGYWIVKAVYYKSLCNFDNNVMLPCTVYKKVQEEDIFMRSTLMNDIDLFFSLIQNTFMDCRYYYVIAIGNDTNINLTKLSTELDVINFKLMELYDQYKELKK